MADRISELLNIMLPTNLLADIGCDHGKAGVAALKRGLAKQVIFSDISAPSLEKAKRLCEQESVQNARFVCCSGCDKIDYADTLLIAGMGSKEITAILRKCKFIPKQLILQPMRNLREIREYLKEDWYVEIDRVVFDKNFYTVLRCSYGKENPDEMTLALGKNSDEKSDDFKMFLEKELTKTVSLLKKSGGNAKLRQYETLLQIAGRKYDGNT